MLSLLFICDLGYLSFFLDGEEEHMPEDSIFLNNNI